MPAKWAEDKTKRENAELRERIAQLESREAWMIKLVRIARLASVRMDAPPGRELALAQTLLIDALRDAGFLDEEELRTSYLTLDE